MVAKFFESLFDYADKVKVRGDKAAYAVVGDVINILKKTYDDSYKFTSYVAKKEAKDTLEALVLSIPGIVCYHDKADDSYFYDLDDLHFDTPEECIQHLIEIRNGVKDSVCAAYRKKIVEYIVDSVKALPVSNIDKKAPVAEAPHD